MDFRGWKKICEDKKTCTLEHPKGHKLTVAMRGLSALHREQIKMLKMASGGRVKMDDGTPDGAVGDDQSMKTGGGDTHITINAAAAPAEAPTPAVPVNPAAALSQKPIQTNPPAPVQGEPNVAPNGQTNPAAVNRNVQRAAVAQKDIDTAQAQAEGQNLGDYNKALGDSMQQYQNRYNDMAKHVGDFADYMKTNPIDPKHYQENMGSGAKTATALGLFFGGLGTPFGGHNYAMDFLNRQIDRDIDAQKARADQQKTVYGAYRDLYGEGKEAYAATRATMLDILNNKQQMIAKQFGTPQAAQKSLALSNQLAIDAQKGLRDSAVPIHALPGANGGGGFGQAPGSKVPMPAARPDRVLTPEAHRQYEWSMSPYNNVQSQQQKEAIQKQYQDAFQVDKALDQIDNLFPQLQNKATYGGYLANKIDPTTVGGLFGMGAEAMGVAGAPATGGASILAALPAAAGAAGAGYAGASAVRTGLRAMGGQTETQYETAKNSLQTIIGKALSSSGLTPTEIGKIADEFAPTKADSKDTAKDKLEKLKQKIMAVANTSALNSAKMTNSSAQ
jgi:hypothetical protein